MELLEKRKKFDAKSKRMVFIGYSETQKGLRCLYPENRTVIVSRDVKFLDRPDAKVNDNVLIDLSVITTADEKAEVSVTPTFVEREVLSGEASEGELDECSYFDDDESDDEYVPDETIPPPVGDIRRSNRPRIARQPFTMSAELVNFEEPATYREATKAGDKQQWIAAMNEEVQSHGENGSRILVKLPAGRKNIEQNGSMN